MKNKLITPNLNEEFCYKLTKKGKQVCENGGWLEHLKKQKDVKNKPVIIEKKLVITFKRWIKGVFRVL